MVDCTTYSLESNRKIKFNFDGGELSSDSGLLLVKEFMAKIGLVDYIRNNFHTNDTAITRLHTDSDNFSYFPHGKVLKTE